MSAAERRAELRKKKILENAEARQQKITAMHSKFSKNLNGVENCDDAGQPSAKDDPILQAKESNNVWNATEIVDDPPVETEILHQSTANIFTQEPITLNNNVQTLSANDRFDIPILSIVVCLLLWCNLGSLISNNVVLPFVLWETKSIIKNRNQPEAFSGIDQLLLIIGVNVRTSLMAKLFKSLMKTKILVEHFLFYMFTIILWQATIGFPEESSLDL